MMQDNADCGNGDWGKSLLLFAIFESKIVGILCVRYDLTAELREQYGNIGYHVITSVRRNGYATEMLRHGLKICKKGLQSALVGCNIDNAASQTVITRCGGMQVSQRDGNCYFEYEL